MAVCEFPILAVSLCKNSEDKHVLKFLPSSEIEKTEDLKAVYGCDEVFFLPCGRCPACRKEYAEQWAKRCSIEAKMHKFNYFITLTYDDRHLCFSSKYDFTQRFLKNLGYKLTGVPIRPKFFACMEKGDLTGRLHFHAILFLDKELTLKDPVKKGDFYHYHSEEIADCWTYGLHDISPFEHDCAAYVGKYATKQGRCCMSRNLGKSYYLAHRSEIIKDDFKIYVDFNKRNFIDIPKCFVKWFLEDDCLPFNDFIKLDEHRLNQKQLQRLLTISEIRSNKMTSESQLVAEKILAFYKHNLYKGERSEF